MQPSFFGYSRNSHTSAEESHLVDVREEHSGGRVDAEYTDGRERGDGADPETDEVSQGGDGDRNSSFCVRFAETIYDAQFRVRPSPSGQQNERVVHSDT